MDESIEQSVKGADDLVAVVKLQVHSRTPPELGKDGFDFFAACHSFTLSRTVSSSTADTTSSAWR